jgi:clusterin-associated protein 1
MAQKGRLALKAKHLYAADGRAVRELLKIARVLYQATRANKALLEAGSDLQAVLAAEMEDAVDPTVGMASRLSELASTASLAGEITTRGARLDSLLEEEPKLREARQRALRFLDAVSSNMDSRSEHDHLQKSIREAIENVRSNVDALEKQPEELESDKSALEEKLSKKAREKDRNEKRLAALKNQRPAFMDEYERLEGELAEEYEVYMTRFRNLHYLEHQLDTIGKRDKARMEANNRALQRLQDRWREQERDLFRGDEGDGGDEDSYSDEGDYAGDPSAVAAARAGGGAGRMGGGGGVPQFRQGGAGAALGAGSGGPRGVVGSMAAADDDESDQDDLDDAGDFSSTDGSDVGDDDEGFSDEDF